MSTQCGIAIKTEKGYETIYVHSDGYPEYMWPMLTENYNSEEMAKKLVALGDASFIDERLEPTPGCQHSFDKREPGVSVFYHRDRGEVWSETAPAVYLAISELKPFYYAYLWKDGCWNFYKGGKKVY